MSIKKKMRLVPTKPRTGAKFTMRGQPDPLQPNVIGEGEGKGNIDYVCGLCGHTIMKSLKEGHEFIGDIFFECGKCGAWNKVE